MTLQNKSKINFPTLRQRTAEGWGTRLPAAGAQDDTLDRDQKQLLQPRLLGVTVVAQCQHEWHTGFSILRRRDFGCAGSGSGG
jgi:hypothetical protein